MCVCPCMTIATHTHTKYICTHTYSPRLVFPAVDDPRQHPRGPAFVVNILVKPVVFDRHPEVGGLLTFGIPEFKLEKSVMARRREIFESMGIEFRLNTEVGKDISVGELMETFDAIF